MKKLIYSLKSLTFELWNLLSLSKILSNLLLIIYRKALPMVFSILIMNLAACGEQSGRQETSGEPSEENAEDNSQTPEVEASDTEKSEEESEVSQHLKADLSFGDYRWYKGMIDEKIPIWLHVRNSYENTQGNLSFMALYGYNSQRGKNIQLQGEYLDNGTVKMGMQIRDHEESFEGKLDPETGNLKGTWINDGKRLPFFLEPNHYLPLNFEGFLTRLATLEPPVSLSETQYQKHYQTQLYETLLPNLQDFVPQLKMAKPSGVLLGKYPLEDNHYLVLFRYDSQEEHYAGAYTEDKEDSYAATLFDSEGKCLSTQHLGNGGHYLDFSLILASGGKLQGEWIYLGRGYNPDTQMSATMQMGGSRKVWQVNLNKKQFELIKNETWED